MFVKALPNSHGWVTGRSLGEIWQNQFDWVYRNFDYAIFPITIHPDASGKPHVLMMMQRLVEHMLAHSGVRMVTFAEMAEDFRKRAPFWQEGRAKRAERVLRWCAAHPASPRAGLIGPRAQRYPLRLLPKEDSP